MLKGMFEKVSAKETDGLSDGLQVHLLLECYQIYNCLPLIVVRVP